MLSQSLLSLVSLALFGTAVAAPSSLKPSPRAAQICYDSETTDLLCYTAPDNTPQDVVVTDVTYIAAYLRAYGAQTKAGRLYTMAAADAPDCGEWTIYSHGSAQAIAKHIDNTVNTSVLFADIANTIDGGSAATAAQQAAALIGCGTDGGSLGVVYNASNTAYTASTYPAGYTPAGILVKIVATGA
ncbi:hypothetical protein F4781DRAFT_90252 [Annulohypoxylon bovei var. microspora]|nr:hypothetical protein F4781DRAFT_90252 [Annulohypoxylon bovei var. microspora]